MEELLLIIANEYKPKTGTAREFQEFFYQRLKEEGYDVTLEWKVKKEDGSNGYIDLVIMDIQPIGIELDRKSPRQNSISKLKTFGSGFVITRSPVSILKVTQDKA